LLSDDNIAWNGTETLSKIARLRDAIDEHAGTGDFIAIAFPNSAVQALAVVAVIASGRVPVMLSYSDFTVDPVEWTRRARASLVLAAGPFENFGEIPATCLFLSPQGEPRLARTPAATPALPAAEPGTALVLFTSGSTGTPKGVFVPSEGLLATVDFLIPYFGLDESSVAPVMLPICHSMALNTQFLPTLLAGGRSHFVNSRLSLNRLYRTILERRGTLVSLIGETLHICWDEWNRRKLPAAVDVRHVQLAGGLISSRHLEMARELFPNAIVHKGYGLTEAIRATMIDQRDEAFTTAAVGKPLPFVQVEVRDDFGAAVTAAGARGEIHVKGPNVMLGGFEHKAKLDERGFLATGDLGAWNERGQLCALGRKDGLLRVNGRWFSSFEVEKAVLESSSSILNAKCLSILDGRREGTKVVLLVEIPPDLQNHFLCHEIARVRSELSEQLRRLPHFPKEIVIIDRFPRTSNGKLAVSKLAELYQSSRKDLLSERPDSPLRFFHVIEAA
jgi:long-chain acyl-CoA synthetase